MYLIKDIYGNYIDAEKAYSFEVQNDGIGFEVVAVTISGDKRRDVYLISRYDTKEDAQEYINALAKTINEARR